MIKTVSVRQPRAVPDTRRRAHVHVAWAAARMARSSWRTLLPLIIWLASLAETILLVTWRSFKNAPHATCPPMRHGPCPKRRRSLETTADVAASAAAPAAATVPAAAAGAFLAARQSAGREPTEDRAALPYYDIIGLIFAVASEHDVLRMDAAAETWLAWKDPAWTFSWIVVLCTDDPGVGKPGCKAGIGCARSKKNVILVPCKHGYSTIVTKSTEGFRYVTSHYRFKYLLKADIDTMVDMSCVARAIKETPGKCKSFGMGGWRAPRSSKVFRKSDPGAGKYPNEPFIEDSGFSHYPPYMVGCLNVWTADVAHFIGMAGLPSARMPRWKSKWTIDDAAIGTFVMGLDICHLQLPCKSVTDVEYEQFAWRYNGDVTGHELKIVEDGPVKGFKGPLRDDVPGTGDIDNVWTETLEVCAEKCRANPECRSFEHSPTAGKRAAVKNCQLATGTQLEGKPCADFNLYLKELEQVPPDGPVEGFEGPLPDDVPGLGDLANVFTETLAECAKQCRENPRCKSFEHSPTYRKTLGIKNCQLNSRTSRAGVKFQDFSLYLLKEGTGKHA